MVISQVSRITLANVKGIRSRWRSSLVVVIAVAGVVSVIVGLLSLLSGIERTVEGTARADRAIVLGAAARSEVVSMLSRESASTIEGSAAFLTVDGQKAFVKEALVIVTLAQSPSGSLAEFTLRGTAGRSTLVVRPEVKIVQGRMFEAGKKELIVGLGAQALLRNSPQVGSVLTINNDQWVIVGIFSSNGDMHESEIWADVETVLSDFRRESYQSATGLLVPGSGLAHLQSLVSASPAVKAEVKTESEYFAAHSQRLNLVLGAVAKMVGGIMALGALLAAVNTMMSALQARYREIGILRALGFGLLPVVVSMVVEALVLTLIGAGVGALLSVHLLDGNSMSTLVRGSSSRIAFELHVTASHLATAAMIAATVAVLSCILPSIRARRIPVTALICSI